jgi:ATP-binding cassette, subfamily B, bacterial CvaB/MchF/RaxB
VSDLNLALSRRSRTPVIYQDEAAECGLTCLAMIASHHGHQIDLISLRTRFGVSIKGMTLTTLLRTAEALELDARPLRCEVDHLGDVALPVILHWSFNHFVVLTAVKRARGSSRFVINDPAQGQRTITEAELSKEFTGVIVEVVPTMQFRPRRERAKLSLWQLWSRAPGLGGAISRILLLSLLIELFSLAAPFYLEVGLDSVVPAHDLNFLSALALGFGMLALLNQITSFARSWAVVSLSNELGYRLVSNLFRHLVRLPLQWFHKRSTGDVLARFNASQPITQLLSSGMIQAVVDGIMASITVLLMLMYSPILTLVTVTGLAFYSAIRLSYFGVLRTRSLGAIQAQAREQANLIETVRGITAIRLFGHERNRHFTWQTRKVDAVNASIGVQRLQAIFTAANSTVVALENIVFVYLAIRMNLNGQFTIGMITAFGAYKHQFLTASLNVVGSYADYKMLDVQLNRIGDVALTEPEPQSESIRDIEKIEQIVLRGVCYNYGPGEPNVLNGVDLTIQAGERIAIIGPSGSGKSTLLRVIMGLVPPTKGYVSINNRRMSTASLAAYRASFGCVLQEDTLFAGTILENISFFDPHTDHERVEECARLAIIYDDIQKMPMAYESLVGDMGSALSGGQKQRILLARALYRNPQLLVLDEATSHLDAENEAKVNASLRERGVACVIVAHRPSTIAMADRVVKLVDGKISTAKRGITPVAA